MEIHSFNHNPGPGRWGDKIINANKTNPPDSVTYLESHNPDAIHKPLQNGQHHQAVCIHCHSIRNRATDADGISAKAVIDGIVQAGLLKDDSPAYVKEVTFSQETTKGPEVTVITISTDGR